ncbi:hypothetical protein [Paenibacillus sp. V4I9]|nr:hypothetical protein [Paenibacillus sp. V4I9]
MTDRGKALGHVLQEVENWAEQGWLLSKC